MSSSTCSRPSMVSKNSELSASLSQSAAGRGSGWGFSLGPTPARENRYRFDRSVARPPPAPLWEPFSTDFLRLGGSSWTSRSQGRGRRRLTERAPRLFVVRRGAFIRGLCSRPSEQGPFCWLRCCLGLEILMRARDCSRTAELRPEGEPDARPCNAGCGCSMLGRILGLNKATTPAFAAPSG